MDRAIEMDRLMEGRYADCDNVIMVSDNLNTHTRGAFHEVFEPERAQKSFVESNSTTLLILVVG